MTEVAVDVGLNELLFVSETRVLSEVGGDGRARFKYSSVNGGVVGNGLPSSTDLCLGEDDIFVSTQGVSFNAPELSLLSRRQMPVLTKIAFLFRSLCRRRDELARDVCLVPSSAGGVGNGD